MLRTISITLLFVGCQSNDSTIVPNHEESAIEGLERTSSRGFYRAGRVEEFRALVDREVLNYQWTASGGNLKSDGPQVRWTLPDAPSAWLELKTTHNEMQSSAIFSFLISAPGVIDPSTDVTGSVCDLAFDPTDRPHLIYRNDTHPSLWYATYDGVAWSTELVDGLGFDIGGEVMGQMSVVLDGSNRPHIGYLLRINNEYQVRYATKNGSTWILERADNTQPYYSVASEPEAVAIALNPTNNEPTIAYTTSPPSGQEAVVITRRTGVNSWSNALGPENEHEFAGGMAFSGGTLHYAARDDTGGQVIWMGQWTSGGGFLSEQSLSADNTSSYGARVALDVGGSPVVIHNQGLAHKVGNSWVYSEIETSGISRFDITFNGATPHVVLRHGSHVEMVTTNSRGYWLYTEVGDDDGGWPAIAIDATGLPHICYQANDTITFH